MSLTDIEIAYVMVIYKYSRKSDVCQQDLVLAHLLTRWNKQLPRDKDDKPILDEVLNAIFS